MEKQHESSNNENFSKADEKSLSPSIPEHNISETQTSSNTEDQASGQVADNDADANLKECNPPETETINLPESSATEIAKPSSSKSALELKLQSSLQEDIQKIKSDNKLKNYNKLRCTKPSSTELSSTKSSLTESLKATLKESKRPCILDFSRTKIKKIAIRYEDILNSSITQNLEAISFDEQLMTYMKQISQENNSDKMIESSESDKKSKECENEKIENRQKCEKTHKMSTYELLQWAYVIAKSKLLITFVIFFTSILPMSIMHEIIKKLRLFKPMFMIIYDNYDNLFKVQKDKKPEDTRNKKVKVCRKIHSSKYLVKILFLLFLVLIILSVLIFLFYFPFGLVRKNENDEHADTFATAVVEVEEGILDHDATVRVLTEYLERDTPLLKVIALIGDTSVDKPYTMDIIKKNLRKRRNNSSSPSLPSFVVLENLRAEHSTVVIDYMETYQEAYGNREFTIVAVFKVEQIDDDLTRADINHVINKVKDIFIEANIIMKIIPFQPLSEEALEKYIINTAENIGQTLSQDQIDYNKRRLIDDFTNCQKEYDCYKDHI